MKQVTWQLLSRFLCSLSVRVTQRSQNVTLGSAETRKLSFRSYVITHRLFTLASAKTDAEICNTHPCVQTDSGKFPFRFCGPWGRRQESYLSVLRLYEERGQKQYSSKFSRFKFFVKLLKSKFS